MFTKQQLDFIQQLETVSGSLAEWEERMTAYATVDDCKMLLKKAVEVSGSLTEGTKAHKMIKALGQLATETAIDQDNTPHGRKVIVSTLTEAMGLPQESLVRLYDIITK